MRSVCHRYRISMPSKLRVHRLIWRPRTRPESPVMPLASFSHSSSHQQSVDSVTISDVLAAAVSSQQRLVLNGNSMEHPLHGILSEIVSVSGGRKVTCIVLKPHGDDCSMEYETSCLRAQNEFRSSNIDCLLFDELDNGFDMKCIIDAANALQGGFTGSRHP